MVQKFELCRMRMMWCFPALKPTSGEAITLHRAVMATITSSGLYVLAERHVSP